MTLADPSRFRNPFHDPLVTELIEDPQLYRKMFSEQIVVGETIQLFQPANVIVIGPQGSGKSMLLNLIRYSVLSEWVSASGKPPSPLRHVDPFLGISINLVRANFHAFGRRSISKAMGSRESDSSLEVSCAADFLGHFLFREFLKGIQYLAEPGSARLRSWLRLPAKALQSRELVSRLATLRAWSGYYSECDSIPSLLSKAEARLNVWRQFLNANIDEIPSTVWSTKAPLEGPLHEIGNLLTSLVSRGRLPLFVVIDQYEVLPELNKTHGTLLQRVVNTLIKLRDPVVFYKIGARSYDWGSELRIWGADSRIEVQRDYVLLNLADLLTRGEDAGGWLFPRFAQDVAHKRLSVEGHYAIQKDDVPRVFGDWTPRKEAELYFRDKRRRPVAIGPVPDKIRAKILSACGRDPSPLELRLAGAWVLQQRRRSVREAEIITAVPRRPWQREWWRKERVGVALLQIASLANQKRRYWGWRTVLFLSGGNISAFLLLCAEIWDMARKMGIQPITKRPLPVIAETEGIFVASTKWRERDRTESIGGRFRYDVLGRLGPAIRASLREDSAISNPGHSGFSIRETELSASDIGKKVREFLERAVSWAILEERVHTSKEREGATRRKWYLHPLLSPFFGIPHVRVKEPLYVSADHVYEWLFGADRIRFGTRARSVQRQPRAPGQMQLPLGGA